jgi:hypothetical protein
MPELQYFAFIPMLTGDIVKGKKKSATKNLARAAEKGKAGTQNKELVTLMELVQDAGRSMDYFNSIEEYCERERIAIKLFNQIPFSHETRERYFRHVLAHIPHQSLVFLDPDTGLEESTPSEKHLLLSEAKALYDRMDPGSVLMIYQHYPRMNRKDYRRTRCLQLKSLTGSAPVAITDNEIVFFLLAKRPEQAAQLNDSLERYANSYLNLDARTCG